ncbi:transcription factor GTE1 isoform X2 [Punica granatum]|nr:transcription factor GTE1 isoform X2 [Punica granatum]OWM70167.1 hypothetical protein CDL15_Pgr026017 [Punica granatum]PKI43258.1 hypothetical protein CRG98_036344 [Punica granatum]
MEDVETRGSASEVEAFQHHLDQILIEVNRLEERVGEVEQFYEDKSKMQLNAPKGSSILRNGRQGIGIKKPQQVASDREADAARRMQELMSQFATILRQITQHKWAFPFMQPVDVEGLGLHDYHEVIDKPMDFTTIKKRMEAKDDSSYKNVREICADVRLVFKNAMKYNDEKNNIHVMAKTLLAKFEEKWLQLLPKVIDEERTREREEAESQLDMQLAKEVEHARMARDISKELSEVETNLEELRELVLQKCRKLSVFDKMQLLQDFHQLPLEDMMNAIRVVAQSNPGFPYTVEHVDLELNPENDSAAWSLKFLVENALELQSKDLATTPVNSFGCSNKSDKKNMNCRISANRRKKEICEAIAESAKRRRTKPS